MNNKVPYINGVYDQRQKESGLPVKNYFLSLINMKKEMDPAILTIASRLSFFLLMNNPVHISFRSTAMRITSFTLLACNF